jgi:hypothetical protein
MLKNQSTIIIFLLIVLIAIAGYIAFFKDKKTDISLEPPATISHTPAATTTESVNWQDKLGEVTVALKRDLARPNLGNVQPITILRGDADVTGDGIPEALVYTGDGGAYTDELAVMRLEEGKVVTALYKQKDGTTGPFLVNGGASALNQLDYGMVSAKNAVYQTEVMRNSNGTTALCTLDAYVWNSQTNIFEYSLSVSKDLEPGYCKNVNSQG